MWNNLGNEDKAAWVVAQRSADKIVAHQQSQLPPLAPLPLPPDLTQPLSIQIIHDLHSVIGGPLVIDNLPK